MRDADRSDVEAYLSGERSALDRLVLRHRDRIYNLCFRLLGDPDDAQECAQETFVKVFRSLDGFRLQSSFSTWLHTIAVNTCRNRRNSAEFRFWKRVLRFGQARNEDDEPFEVEIPDSEPSVLTQLAEMEKTALVQSAMNALPYDYRTVLVLRHVQELSYEEICKITGYNPGTLKSKLARARVQLQKKIQACHGESRDGML
ncbi:MAG: sigma-70 family RNA polymerase sigma factor [Desulfobacteraceae bacterium]|nr:sigma-70 family RNA polymerase sigma factor [Desulfobacteraceae bacterium]